MSTYNRCFSVTKHTIALRLKKHALPEPMIQYTVLICILTQYFVSSFSFIIVLVLVVKYVRSTELSGEMARTCLSEHIYHKHVSFCYYTVVSMTVCKTYIKNVLLNYHWFDIGDFGLVSFQCDNVIYLSMPCENASSWAYANS